ncbi:MAG: flagellar biosynthesis protein FlhB [Bdellovibrionales bacterium]|nr:flagellar biosynthesis protein FlhB [Bdellovibrionales bacterium]
MAENQEDRSTEDLLDEASQARIDEMREKGQVAQSRELVGLLSLLAAAATLWMFAPKIGLDIAEYMRETLRVDEAVKMNFSDKSALNLALMKCLKLIVMIGLPISMAGFVFGVAGSFMQIGSIFSFEPLTPNLEKIDPIKGAMRFLSMKFLFESFRMMIKVVVSVYVAYLLVKSEVLTSPELMITDPSRVLAAFSASGRTVFLVLIAIGTVFAGIDYWLQRREWMKQVRLTRQEAKEEAKEREGNPQVKARIRSIQREMSRKRMMAAVKKADVIVTNPTHIAIAIQYDKDKMLAPKVVAKGADFVAQKIKALAAEAGVPTVENVPLARTLYKSVKINQYIPRALYQAVAEVLAYVYRLRNRKM